MSKKKRKGRKHRTVNRTPRPGPAPKNVSAEKTPIQATAVSQRPAPEQLGHHAARTYGQLLEHGPHSIQHLCEAVGYTKRTIMKHVDGLAQIGLAVQEADGRWAAVNRTQNATTSSTCAVPRQ
ncbi:ArsR family transcriptional regulator [Streptomyces sp. NBC_00569]|uniref:helix-turn-helix transcriptional regulator n=1 Tax=Streptomyces sp. NBC_00569 TaxID=2975780 RepID=UPI002E80198F|nr:helix-turn-helix transcriptional regulator [Streptomyces sp. NBC_00569]WUB92359.1 ArsR family transcriptional regulator [Streptomyces sp. NBC_00569]